MGPWSHGDWARNRANQIVGDIHFGDNLSDDYQREVEAPFFRHFLKGEGEEPDFEALVYDTGRKEWKKFAQWPPEAAVERTAYLRPGEKLTIEPPDMAADSFTEYLSDPNEPVPHTDQIRIGFTPRRVYVPRTKDLPSVAQTSLNSKPTSLKKM